MTDRGRVRDVAATAVAASVVFGIAFALRWICTADSFWIDELHTGWAISGDWGEIAGRARAGNQSPAYFQAMWVWSRVFGAAWIPAPLATWPVEVAWRCSSVLLSAITCAVVVVTIRRMTGRLIGGIIAGGLLAVEQNSIFFGTELRPYAAVMLCGVMACAAGGSWLQSSGRAGLASMVATHVAVLAATTMHVTSLMTLGIWLILVSMVDVWRTSGQTWPRHAAAASIWIAVILWHASGLGSVWADRGNWQSFAGVRGLGDIANLWPWCSLLFFPLAASWLATRPDFSGWQKRRFDVMDPTFVWSACLVLSVGISTAVCFAAAWMEILPLWHRRYLVAGLPMLTLLTGLAAARVIGTTTRTGVGKSIVVGALAIVSLGITQHQFAALASGRIRWVARNEDWRGAVAAANTRLADSREAGTGGSWVWLDPDLVEQADDESDDTGESDDGGEAMKSYLTFAVAGPYPLDPPNTVRVVGRSTDVGDVWPALVLSRGGDRNRDQWLRSRHWQRQRFGSVELWFPPDDPAKQPNR